MVYFKFPKFKTGSNPSIIHQFNVNALTGTQKLMLAHSRIFGTNIPGNAQTGNKILRRPLKGAKRLSIFEIPIWNHKIWFPFLRDHQNDQFQSELMEGRKLRILMRGVKIGRKKGTAGLSMMNIFEKKADKPAAEKGEAPKK